jgi:hypothetical protein
MPRKLPQDCIIDISGTVSVRPPRGIDLRALANERGLKINALMRELILDYVEKRRESQREDNQLIG